MVVAFVIIFITFVNLCHLSDNFIEEFNYSSSIVPNEFIVSFSGYHNGSQRNDILLKALQNFDLMLWKELPRKNSASQYQSDFSLLQIYSDVDRVVSTLKKHTLIKGVTEQRMVARTLKNVNPNHLDTDSWTPRNLKKSNFDSFIEEDSVKSRKILRAIPRQISHVLQANVLWGLGHRGKGVKVAVFDTGLPKSHPHFKNIKDRTDWTEEKTVNDEVGHGTFVAGVIASDRECYGFAPEADLYIFRVFTNKQVSYTSWFLDAFNYAILKNIDILNLSIGGPDFMDKPFVDKVWELTANNVIMVSAIGNDGPLYGTLNNPADQMDVIGVGGINFDDKIASFSSRGMTTHELPYGYGRIKPDIVTYGASVTGSSLKGGCRSLSGTSVASPVVAGALALLLSSVASKNVVTNPASVKQAIIESATRIPDANMFEQGHGKFDLIKAYKLLSKYKPHASVIPNYLDLTECPYMWPYCSQPLYYSAMPVLVNMTILNGMGVTGRIKEMPIWEPLNENHGNLLKIAFAYSDNLWPWSGYLAVYLSVSKEGEAWTGIVQGVITLSVTSYATLENEEEQSKITIPVKVSIIPTPLKSKRILWDQFHNLRYPSGYFPRDNLNMKMDPLDWNADHIHTNYKDLYTYLRSKDYFIEVLGLPFTCFNANDYGVLLIIDPEEEYFDEEIVKLTKDIFHNKLSVIVVGEWYNVKVMDKIQFYDENTRQWWTPVTGGANIPALNELMKPWGISLTDQVYSGEFKVGTKTVIYASGATIGEFPKEGFVMRANKLYDQAAEVLFGEIKADSDVPIIGFYDPSQTHRGSGRIVVYGDSNCLDSAHMTTDCFWLLDEILNYTINGGELNKFLTSMKSEPITELHMLTTRLQDNKLHLYSKVIEQVGDEILKKPIPNCPSIKWNVPLSRKGFAPEYLLPVAVPMTAPT
ncbi:membrane-bound transcription factor site-1 protease isoform X1 [Hydra vulgaris]|uniref:membrane-bound transcription factor site-1 protease isoform X1 n=1 Tax=Hydra vulgaris TaxID=6087 RepID=UPI0002B4B597|nr:membrane-bound transcription factor site-1 protease isoform X1 [Hydra vulgaris]